MNGDGGSDAGLDISDLYGRRFDFSGAQSAQERHFYTIASTARSGSTYLAILLYQRVGFGLPLEYFNLDRMEVRLAQRSCATAAQYRADVVAKRTDGASGYFGLKCLANAALSLERQVPDIFDRHILRAKVVRLIRTDRVQQAVSMARAIQTGRWFYQKSEQVKPVYDRNLITECMTRTRLQNRWWSETLERRSEPPLAICYEDLLADPDTVVDTLAAYLKIPNRRGRGTELPDLNVQRDEINAEWAGRYRAEGK